MALGAAAVYAAALFVLAAVRTDGIFFTRDTFRLGQIVVYYTHDAGALLWYT